MKLLPQSFALPDGDPKFTKLGDDMRNLVIARLDAMREIADAPKPLPAISAIARRRAGQRGWGRGTLINKWYSFLREGTWEVLLDKTQAGAVYWSNAGADRREAFIEYLGSQWSMRQRGKFRGAWIDLKARWEAWRAGVRTWQLGDHEEPIEIPGYDKCPEPRPDTCLPEGWTYENLHRLAKQGTSRYARKLIQIGPKAAHNEFTYKVPTTRAGIEVGQIFLFDDSWNDFRVLYRGRGSRILSLHALDLASACACVTGHKPTVEDERGVEERLREREMVFMVAALLSVIGYRADGTTFICEKGTATIRKTEEIMLDRLTSGKISVQTGPAGGGPGIAGLFADRSGGNPRWKAPIESFFNLLRNRTGHMLEFPGQLGSNSRLNLPEGTARMELADEAMARAAQLLTPERQQQIRFNLLQYENARPILDSRIEFCNTRRDHALEGWRASGYFVPAFRLGPTLPFLPFTLIDQLRPEAAEQLRVMLAADPQLAGEIQMSPREVFNAGKDKLKRLAPPQIALLLAETAGEERDVKRGILEFECPDVDPCRPLAFGPTINDCNGGEGIMQCDDKFLVRVNPFDPSRAFLYNAKGGFIGITHSRGRAGTRLDEAALQGHFKAKSAQVSTWNKEARQLAAPLSQAADAVASNNAAVIAAHEGEKTDFASLAEAALMQNSQQ